MAANKLNKQLLLDAVDLVEKHGSLRQAHLASGIARQTLQHRIKRAKELFGITPNPRMLHKGGGGGGVAPDPLNKAREWSENSDGASLTIRTDQPVRTKEDVLRIAELDETRWRITGINIKAYEGFHKDDEGNSHVVPMWSIGVKLVPVHPMDMEAQRDEFIRQMKAHAPKYTRKPATRSKAKHALELTIPDIHVGKLAWSDETGEHWDLDLVKRVYHDAVEALLNQATRAYDISRIIFPIGNDLLHVDTHTGTTTAGTAQDQAGRHLQAYVQARLMLIEAIDKLRTVAPVDAVVVRGNHDRCRTFFLGDALQCWYGKDKHVTIDNAPKTRKYVTHGRVLIGYTHGDEEKHNDLESLMIREQPEAFARSAWREWHLGHLHKRKETRYVAGDTHGGTVVRIIPSLTATDAWHYRQGYVLGPKGAEAYVWSPERFEGMFNHTPANATYQPEGKP